MSEQKHLLLVEDDASIRDLLAAVARRTGHETTSASNGGEAIELLAQRKFCAVVLDLMMPGVSGYDVVVHIREKKLSVPVVVVTAAIRSIEWVRLPKDIVVAVLTKPFEIEKLISAIESACASHGRHARPSAPEVRST